MMRYGMFIPDTIKTCEACSKRYVLELTPQKPGFKWDETAYCPHCGATVYDGIGSDPFTRKLTENEEKDNPS